MTPQDDQSSGSRESVADVTRPDPAPADAVGSERPDTSASGTAGTGQLVPEEAVIDLRARWEAIQQGFVDDPRSAVSDADKLVGEVLQKLSATFESQHRELEGQWAEGEPSTEDLRGALQRYRDFFQRLLTI
jgi:hypothetical protein